MDSAPVSDRRNRILFWMAYAVAWAALGAWLGINVIIGHRNSGQPIAAWEPMTWELSSAALMAVLAVLVYKFERRLPLSGPHWLHRLPWHVPALLGSRPCIHSAWSASADSSTPSRVAATTS